MHLTLWTKVATSRSGIAKYPSINGLPKRKLNPEYRIKQIVGKPERRFKYDIINNCGVFITADGQTLKAMTVVPVRQKKRKTGPLVDKEDFGRRGLLVNDLADPVLAKQKKVKLQMNDIAPQTTIETNNVYGRERRAELLEKGTVKTSPNGG